MDIFFFVNESPIILIVQTKSRSKKSKGENAVYGAERFVLQETFFKLKIRGL